MTKIFGIASNPNERSQKLAEVLGCIVDASPNLGKISTVLQAETPEELDSKIANFARSVMMAGITSIEKLNDPETGETIPLGATISMLDDRILVAITPNQKDVLDALRHANYQEVAPSTQASKFARPEGTWAAGMGGKEVRTGHGF